MMKQSWVARPSKRMKAIMECQILWHHLAEHFIKTIGGQLQYNSSFCSLYHLCAANLDTCLF
jgi:hypothetical protein